MPRTPGKHVDDPAAVGRRLRAAREAAGMSQRELSLAGCTPAYISRVEAGMRVPSLQLLEQLARRLGTTAQYLATGGSNRDTATLLDEAEAATRLGELETAETGYRAILAGEPTTAESHRARLGLAEIAYQRGDPRSVIELLEGLDVDAVPSLPADAAAWRADRLGRSYAQVGAYESSLAVLERAIERARDGGDELAVLRLLTLLANSVLDQGDVGRAEVLLADAINLADRSRDPVDVARIWWSQSRLHIQQRRPELATRYIRKTIGLLDAREHRDFAATAYQLLARIENDRGNHLEALTLIERAEPSAFESGNRYHLALFELERARALAGAGEADDAGSVAMRAAALLEESSPGAAGRGYAVLAEVFRSLGDAARACELYELSADRLPDDDPFQVEIHTALGGLHEAAGRTAAALEAYKRAAQLRARAVSH